jgi:hypothetical protein
LIHVYIGASGSAVACPTSMRLQEIEILVAIFYDSSVEKLSGTFDFTFRMHYAQELPFSGTEAGKRDKIVALTERIKRRLDRFANQCIRSTMNILVQIEALCSHSCSEQDTTVL